MLTQNLAGTVTLTFVVFHHKELVNANKTTRAIDIGDPEVTARHLPAPDVIAFSYEDYRITLDAEGRIVHYELIAGSGSPTYFVKARLLNAEDVTRLPYPTYNLPHRMSALGYDYVVVCSNRHVEFYESDKHILINPTNGRK
jgi:hypothetical protein